MDVTAEQMIEHAKRSPIVSAGWLNEDKQDVAEDPPEKWAWRYVLFEDGGKVFLSKEESKRVPVICDDISALWGGN